MVFSVFFGHSTMPAVRPPVERRGGRRRNSGRQKVGVSKRDHRYHQKKCVLCDKRHRIDDTAHMHRVMSPQNANLLNERFRPSVSVSRGDDVFCRYFKTKHGKQMKGSWANKVSK